MIFFFFALCCRFPEIYDCKNNLYLFSENFKFYGHWRRVLSWFISNFQSSGTTGCLALGGNPVNCETSPASFTHFKGFKEGLQNKLQTNLDINWISSLWLMIPSSSYQVWKDLKTEFIKPWNPVSHFQMKKLGAVLSIFKISFSETGSPPAKFLHGGRPLVCVGLQRRRRRTQCCPCASELAGDTQTHIWLTLMLKLK